MFMHSLVQVQKKSASSSHIFYERQPFPCCRKQTERDIWIYHQYVTELTWIWEVAAGGANYFDHVWMLIGYSPKFKNVS